MDKIVTLHIRQTDNDVSATNPPQFSQRRLEAIERQVFEYLAAEDHVKGGAGEGKALDAPADLRG